MSYYDSLIPIFTITMVPQLEKPKITEIQVRMDCNGCIQKIKKALHGINGIYDIYIDIPQQKLTIIGWADPENIVKTIKKIRKTATICSHTQPSESEPPPGEEAPPLDTANHHPEEESSTAGTNPANETTTSGRNSSTKCGGNTTLTCRIYKPAATIFRVERSGRGSCCISLSTR